MSCLPRSAVYTAVSSRPAAVLGLASVVGILGSLVACEVDLGPRVPPVTSSFGAIVFRESCERVTYSAELQNHSGLDVSGVKARALCSGDSVPADADPTV